MMHLLTTTLKNTRASTGYILLVAWFVFTVLTPRDVVAQTPSTPTISVQDLLPVLEDVLIDAGADNNSKIQLSNPNAKLPSTAALLRTDHVQNVSLSKNSGRFVIRFSEPTLPYPITLTGFVRTPVLIPVLNIDIDRGDLIASDNIEWITSLETVDKYTIKNQEDLENMIARRALRAGQAIKGRDVTKPVLISRGALITMEYKRAGLRLTHRAIAEESGGAGDIIIARNPRTDRAVRVRIFAKNRVEVIAAIDDESASRFNR